MEVGGGIFSLKHTKDTGVLYGIWALHIAELEDNLDCVCPPVTAELHPNLIFWDYPSMPCQSVCTAGTFMCRGIHYKKGCFTCGVHPAAELFWLQGLGHIPMVQASHPPQVVEVE